MNLSRAFLNLTLAIVSIFALAVLTSCGGGSGGGDNMVTVTGRFLVPNQATTAPGLARETGDTLALSNSTITVVSIESLPASNRSITDLQSLVPLVETETNENGEFSVSINAGIDAAFITRDPALIAILRRVDRETIGQAPIIADSATTLSTVGYLNGRADGNIVNSSLPNEALRLAEAYTETQLTDDSTFIGQPIDFSDPNSLDAAGARLAGDSTFIDFFNTESSSSSSSDNSSSSSSSSSSAPSLGSCVPDNSTICALDNRFRATVNWSDASNNSGPGLTGEVFFDGGFFFLGTDNTQLLVQLQNMCFDNNHYWVFASATTNVEFELTVTDTLSGETQSYSNDLGTPFEPILDTDAFATCP